MTSPHAADASPRRPVWQERDFPAWAAAILACAVLLGAVEYCPSYFAGKNTLLMLWVDTFKVDLYDQFSSMFSSTSKQTLGGEATASEWTYCMAVPFITAWLVWQLWPRLLAAPKAGKTVGYAILALGFFFYTAGFLMENYYIGMGAMEFIYAGLIVLFFGWEVMRILIFPWLFLMFMWPYNFMEDVALSLRLLMSSLGHHALQLIGVANILHGTAIVSVPDAVHPFAIDIADPCSGIRSLFALVMIAAVFAFLTFEKLWLQAIIVALAVPLVIFGNLVRIMLLALATIHFGEAFAIGTDNNPSWFHESAGYLVYLLNFGGLILVGSWLSRIFPPPKKNARA